MRLPDGRTRKRRRSSDDPTVAHSITFSCFRRQSFLSRERSCQWLCKSLDDARHKHRLDLWAYVFMPNHVHLILWPQTSQFRLARVLSSIKLPVTRNAVTWVKRHAPAFLPKMLDLQPNGEHSHRFWQRSGGYDRDLDQPGTIHPAIDYIHMNPV